MKRPRIIPCLLIDNQNLVKTIKYRSPRYLGDPINAVKIFNEKMVDELCVLDIGATRCGRPPDFDFLQKLASEAFMPLSYGGGIFTSDQAVKLIQLGFEKVILGTSFFENPLLVQEVATALGSQSTVVSIDSKRSIVGVSHAWYKNGGINSKMDVVDCCQEAERLGAGEILLNSINNDGMMKGYDYAMLKKATSSVSIPIIASCGAGGLGDLRKAIVEGGAHAAAAGSLFAFYGKRKAVLINFPEEEELLKEGVYER